MLIMLTALIACSDVEDVSSHGDDHDHGVTTAVSLTFTPTSGGEASVFEFHDGQADEIVLDSEADYDLTVAFLEEDADGAFVDISDEILDDGESHQVFFLTDAPVSIAYADLDDGGLPIGLEAEAVTAAAGVGALRVVLRHMPPESDVAVKVAGLAEQVEADGIASIGGDSDVDVSFDVTVSD
jgi:hypothetical protein